MLMLPTKLTCEVPDQSLETVVNILSHTESFLVSSPRLYALTLLFRLSKRCVQCDPYRPW
jgi:hypothetical protein